jgi:hypothetical protein
VAFRSRAGVESRRTDYVQTIRRRN